MAYRSVQRLFNWLLLPFTSGNRSFWRVVALCFLLASTFWLLNSFNQTYTTRISYPVKISYDTRAFVPLTPLPSEVLVSVTGKGWHILRRNLDLGEVRQAQVRVSGLPGTAYLTGTAIAPALRKEFTRLLVNYVVTDTLYFRFDRRVSHSQQLALDTARLNLPPGLQLVPPIKLSPEKITFTGPASFLDTLPAVRLVQLPQQSLHEGTVSETVALSQISNPLVQVSATHATVQLQLAAAPAGPAKP